MQTFICVCMYVIHLQSNFQHSTRGRKGKLRQLWRLTPPAVKSMAFIYVRVCNGPMINGLNWSPALATLFVQFVMLRFGSIMHQSLTMTPPTWVFLTLEVDWPDGGVARNFQLFFLIIIKWLSKICIIFLLGILNWFRVFTNIIMDWKSQKQTILDN